MPDLDGGHYFFTGIVPICNDGIIEHKLDDAGNPAMRSSPVHMVREVLETLPTALQSHATQRIGIQSPFARSLRTHFARFVVLDQPNFNGRTGVDTLVSTIRGTNLLKPQPVDSLSCPYLLMMIDFDPSGPPKGEVRAYFEELWDLMPEELTAVFEYCYGFSAVKDARSFADFILPCQIETTLPFNDYWVGTPPLTSLSKAALAVPPAAGLLPLAVSQWANDLVSYLFHWSAWPSFWPGPVGLLLGVALAVAGLGVDYAIIMRKGAQSFPPNPDGSLRHVLKALYLQQRFTRFAIEQQGRSLEERGKAFSDFLRQERPADLNEPTQPPGVLRTPSPGVVA